MAREYSTDPYGILARGVPGGDGGASIGSVGSGAYGLRVPLEGGGRFGVGLGSGALGGSGPTIGAGVRIPLNPRLEGDVKKKAKGGLAVKPVWEKKRPEDLGKPKSLTVKKKAFAKRRAKAAGRPYPNLVDNLAAARKKGK